MDYEKLLIGYKVIKKGHFFLTTGLHSDTYIQKDAIFCNPYLFNEIVNEIAKLSISLEYDIITGPAIAGAITAAPLSIILNKIFIYPEKINDHMIFRRGYDKIINNRKVVIIEDIITTGGSVNKTIDSIYKCGGTVSGIICIWNRTNWVPDNKKIHLISMININIKSWDPKKNECPLCAKNIILTDPKK